MTLVEKRAFGLKSLAAAALALQMLLPASVSAQSLQPPTLTIPGVTFTVNTSDDVDTGACTSAHCSFREAINAVNARASLLTFHVDAIVFSLPLVAHLDCTPTLLGGSLCRTVLGPNPIVTSGLPALADTMNINATTQPGFSGSPIVELRGAAGSSVGLSLKRSAGSSTIRGLSITGFGGAAIDDRADNSVIAGNFIGLEPSGAVRANDFGILVTADGVSIGGSAASDRNVISGNTHDGIRICLPSQCTFLSGSGGAGQNTRVLGNYVGTNSAGTAAAGNDIGVHVVGGGFNTTFNVCNPSAAGSVIGGGNVISGNRSTGVAVDECASGATVTQNRIGTNAAGTAAVANGADGVKATNSIGTSVSGNLVSGNANDGINISIHGQSANSVLGNHVGTDASGTQPIPNLGNGLTIDGFPGNNGHNTVGGSSADANTIAFNRGAGIREPSGGTAIRFNSIHDNGALGIDVEGAGVSANQTGSPDAGLPNFPVLSSAVTSSTGLSVSGFLLSRPGQTFTLDFYASPACDPSGSGEGTTYLDSTTVTLPLTDTVTADKSFTVTLFPSTPVAPGSVVTATSTDRFSFTSEFSACRTVTGS